MANCSNGTGMTPADLEARVMTALDLPAYPIAGQTYPRKQDWQVLSALSGVAGSLYKFAFDLRLLQSPVIDEWHEPFGKQQVGSSAMPFKRNPINAEKIDSLGRLVVAMERVAWDNASHSLLERTLDDSANRRETLPVAFLAIDEMIRVTARIIGDLRIDEQAAARNFARFGVFSAVERVLMAAVKAGADRQEMHEHLRTHSLARLGSACGRPAKSAGRIAGEQPDTRGIFNARSYSGAARRLGLRRRRAGTRPPIRHPSSGIPV